MKRHAALLAVLVLCFVLFALGINWGLPDYRGWAPDEIVPSRVIDALAVGFSHGWYDKYPPFHYALLSLAYSPVLLLDKLGVLDIRTLPVYTILFYIGRCLSLLMAMGTIYLVYRCGREILDRRAALASALITALAVPFEYHAKVVNLDVPYLFWFAWSLYFLIRLLKTRRLKYYLLFPAAAAAAVATKDQAYALYLLAPLLIVLFNLRGRKKAGPGPAFRAALFEPKYIYAVLVGAGVFAILSNFPFNFRGFLAHLELITGPASRDYQIFPASLSGQARLLAMTLRQILGSLGLPMLILCGAGLVLALCGKKKNAPLLALPLLAVSYYLFYIARILFNTDRYNLPICLLLSFFGGSLASRLLAPGGHLPKARAVLVAAVFGYSLLYSLSVDILMIADSRYAVERWLAKNVPAGAEVGTAGPGEYLPRLPNFRVTPVPLSLGAFEKGSKPDFVIFNAAFGRSFPLGSGQHEFFQKFDTDRERYRLALRHQSALRWMVVRYRNIGTNMVVVNPEIRVYRRAGQTRGQAPEPVADVPPGAAVRPGPGPAP